MAARALVAQAPAMEIEATYVGVATVLFRIGDVTLLTDPCFDRDDVTVSFGPGFRSTRSVPPAVAIDAVPALDAVLLSHDEHADNLDVLGRALLARAGVVLTTRAAQRRLGNNSIGLAPFATHIVERGSTRIAITATPGRHGPPLSRPLVGEVTGFLLTWEGQREGAIYVSGDTVLYGGIDRVAARGPIAAAFLHLGGAAWNGIRFTMDAKDGARAAKKLGAARVFPIHADGWSHFRDAPSRIAPAFEAAGLGERLVRWSRGDTVRWTA